MFWVIHFLLFSQVLVQPFAVSPGDFVGFFIADGLECPLA